MITRDQLLEMFAGMRKDTSWDLSAPLLWGYFFIHGSADRLHEVAPLLEAQGYRIVDIYQSEPDDKDDPDLWWLHVEKAEVHTPDTLDARNQQLYAFADAHGLDAYDGMDVGPLEPTH